MSPPRDTSRAAPPARRHLFLERESYRKNRLRDAAALMPVFGGLLFFGPAFILTPARATGRGDIILACLFFRGLDNLDCDHLYSVARAAPD